MAAVTVLGLGCVLMEDDAFGPYVVRMLQARYELDPEVLVLDGTPGNDLAPHLMGVEAMVVVDTVKSDGEPGSMRLYDREAILKHPPPPRLNPHQPGIKDTLLVLELMDTGPRDVLLVGTIPASVRTGVGLSPEVRAAVEPALARVVEELTRLGHPPVPRREPLDPDLWWEPRA